MTSANQTTITYRIDSQNIIVGVDGAWEAFARDNGAVGLTAATVLGNCILDYFADARVRHLYQLLFDSARRQQSPLSIPLRCDAPELRRHLELTIVPEADGHLTIRSCTLQTEPREPVPLLDDQSERSNELITICSWCKKVEVEGEWCEVEEAVDRLGLLVEVPHLIHGMCQPCHYGPGDLREI